MRTVVECKWRSKRSVPNQDVYDFISFIRATHEPHGISTGVLVTNTRFSPYAKAAAEKSGAVRLLRIAELEHDTFDVRPILAAHIQNYQASEIYDSYIPLQAVSDPSSRFAPRTLLDNVEESLMSWLKQPTAGFATVVGDYGAGKTTLLRRLKYNVARAYIAGETNMKPLLILLRDFYQCGSVEGLLRHTIGREYSAELPLPLFWRAVNDGEFLLLLDGFDEMSPKVDRERRLENMLLLSSLLTSASKAILSCRPTYFTSQQEFNDALDALNFASRPLRTGIRSRTEGVTAKRTTTRSRRTRDAESHNLKSTQTKRNMAAAVERHLRVGVTENPRPVLMAEASTVDQIELSGLTSQQIERYLEKHNAAFVAKCNNDWEAVADFVREVYDLSDLIRRPILLKMITATLLSGSIRLDDRKISLGAAALYEIYTSKQFDWDHARGKASQLLRKETRRQFTEALALVMLDTGRYEIEYDRIVEIARKNRDTLRDLDDHLLMAVTVTQVATDIQTYTFLSRDDHGRFRFAHKSFMEFFVARFLWRTVLEGRIDDRLRQELPREIRYFLGSFANHDPDLASKFVITLSDPCYREDVPLRRNLAAALLFTGGDLPRFSLTDCDIENVSVPRTIMRHSTIANCTILNADFDDLWTVSCKLKSLRLSNFHGSTWKANKGEWNLRCDKVSISEIEWSDVSIEIAGRDTELRDVTLLDSTVRVGGDIVIDGKKIAHTKLGVFGQEGGPVRLRNVEVLAGELETLHAELKSCTFEGTLIKGNSGTLIEDCAVISSNVLMASERGPAIAITGSDFDEGRLAIEHGTVRNCTLANLETSFRGRFLMDSVELSRGGASLSALDDARGRSQHCQFNDVDVKMNRVEVVDSEFVAGKIYVRGSLLAGCKLARGTFESVSCEAESTRIRDSELREMTIAMEETTVTSSRLVRSRGSFRNVQIRGGSIVGDRTGETSLQLSEVELREVQIHTTSIRLSTQRDERQGGGGAKDTPGTCTAVDCTFREVDLEAGAIDIKNGVLSGCHLSDVAVTAAGGFQLKASTFEHGTTTLKRGKGQDCQFTDVILTVQGATLAESLVSGAELKLGSEAEILSCHVRDSRVKVLAGDGRKAEIKDSEFKSVTLEGGGANFSSCQFVAASGSLSEVRLDGGSIQAGTNALNTICLAHSTMRNIRVRGGRLRLGANSGSDTIGSSGGEKARRRGFAVADCSLIGVELDCSIDVASHALDWGSVSVEDSSIVGAGVERERLVNGDLPLCDGILFVTSNKADLFHTTLKYLQGVFSADSWILPVRESAGLYVAPLFLTLCDEWLERALTELRLFDDTAARKYEQRLRWACANNGS